MATSDLKWFRGGLGHVLKVELRADEGTWLDINATLRNGPTDYYAAVLRRPRVTIKTEANGLLVTVMDSIVCDNARGWAGLNYGFWDAPLPVVVRRADVNYTFASWRMRKVRVSVDVYNQDGAFSANHVLATARIVEVDRNGTSATLKTAGVQKLLMDKSAASIRNGTEWYKGLTPDALMALLFGSVDSAITVASSVGADLTQTFATMRCSSWGAAPGVLTDNTPSIYHWIPRCFARKPDALNPTLDSSEFYVGFEVPGANARSGGALAVFNSETGTWRILLTPESLGMEEAWPVQIIDSANAGASDGFVYFALMREKPVTSALLGFYEVIIAKASNTAPSSGITTLIGATSYWPARWCMRDGFHAVSGPPVVGYQPGGGASDWYGETLVLPIPQVVDTLIEFMYPTIGFNEANTQLWQTSQTQAGNTPAEFTQQLLEGIVSPVGTGGAQITYGSAPATYAGAFRFFLADYVTQPVLYGAAGTEHLYFVSTTPGARTYRLTRLSMYTGTTTTWKLTNLGGGADQLTARSVTAWCLAQQQSGAHRIMYLATTEWDEVGQNTVPPLSKSALYQVTFDGAAGTEATVVEVWSQSPTDSVTPSDCVSIVYLWTPYDTGAGFESTVDYTVAVLVDRGSLLGGCYGIGVIKGAGWTWLCRHKMAGTQKGPVSSRPFKAFVSDPNNDRVFYFTDEANGQVWKCTVDTTANTVVFAVENNSFPAHPAEYAVASYHGFAHLPGSDAIARYIWAQAPGSHGDVTSRYWEQQEHSRSRYVPGQYPITMLSTVASPIIEVADFTDLTAWEAVVYLKELLPNYRLFVDGTETVTLQLRTASTPTLTLVPVNTAGGFVDIEAGEVPIDDGATRRILYSDVVNAIDIVPWALAPKGEADVQTVRAAGSTFEGTFVVSAVTERAQQVSIVAVTSGDVLAGADASQQPAVLFRWARVMAPAHCHLTQACSASDTSIFVAGLQHKGGDVYSGQQKIRVGDFVTVRSGTRRTIASFGAAGDSWVTVNLSGATGASAPIYAEVVIDPLVAASASDGAAGVTALTGVVGSTGQAYIQVADSSQLNRDTVVVVSDDATGKKEYMLVGQIEDTTVYVTRGMFGYGVLTFPVGSIVRAYVSARVMGRLYDVGDTGIQFGIDGDDDMDKTTRSVSAGDGVIVNSKGYGMRALEHVVIRRMDNDSITANQRKEKRIGNNPFISPVLAEKLAEAEIDEWADPKLGVFGIRLPLYPSITLATQVTIADPVLTPASAPFEITGITWDLDTWTMTLDVRSVTSVAGAGRAPGVAGTDTGAAPQGSFVP